MSHRSEQVGSILLKAISRIIQEELDGEHYGLITVTDVVVKGKLDHAKIYISSIRNGREAVKELNSMRKMIIFRLKGDVNLRKIPQLSFEYDNSSERVERLDKLVSESRINS